MINRNVKDNNGYYVNDEIKKFFNSALQIIKNDPTEFERTLFPAICGAIYKLKEK
jgi:hypothetical protein